MEVIFLTLATVVSAIGGFSLEISQRKRYLQAEKLRGLVVYDSLTGLHNKRYFFESAEIIWKQAQRERKPLTIAMADVDFFKDYNDNYGHLKGDECLRLIADVFKSSLKRPFDFVARFGGEEFIFVWYNAQFDFIETEIENILKRVKAEKIPHKASSVDQYVTISAGAAFCLPLKDLTLNSLVEMADECLYKAKSEGRNRAVIYKY